METLPTNRRILLAAAAIGLGAMAIVYLGNDWFHATLLPGMGLSRTLGDALGTLLMVTAAFAGLRLYSVAACGDGLFGMQRLQAEAVGRTDTLITAAVQVAGELRSVKGFNDVVRGHLNGVVAETEKAAFDIAGRLQGIDEIISRLGEFVESTTRESNRVLAASEDRIVQNRALIGTLESFIRQRVVTAQEDRERITQVVKEARSLGTLAVSYTHLARQDCRARHRCQPRLPK